MKRLALVLLLLAGCASSGPRLAQMEADALLKYGIDKATAHKWDEASRALEQFVLQFPTHARYQEARYRLAQVYTGKREFLTAASEFARLANDFPTGDYGDDARFGVCDSYYQLSPKPELDQQYTRTAIEECRGMAAAYPESEFAARAKTMVTELENRLAEKVYLNGDFYFRRGCPDCAIIYFQELLDNYPGAEATPRALLRLYESYTKIGYAEEATQTRERLLKEYPDSKEAQQVKEASIASAP